MRVDSFVSSELHIIALARTREFDEFGEGRSPVLCHVVSAKEKADLRDNLLQVNLPLVVQRLWRALFLVEKRTCDRLVHDMRF